METMKSQQTMNDRKSREDRKDFKLDYSVIRNLVESWAAAAWYTIQAKQNY